MDESMPLSLALQKAKLKMIKSTNEVMQEFCIPATLMDGVICAILSDIRAQENVEISMDMENLAVKAGEEDG